MSLDLAQPRDLGQLLSTCLELYMRHFALFTTLAFAVVLPVDVALYGVAAGQLWSGYDDSPPIWLDIVGSLAPFLLVVPLISSNHARAVMAIGRGETPGIGRTLLEGVRLLPAIALVVLLYTLGAFAALLLIVVPGVFLFVRWYVSVPAAVVERVRGSEALGRSAKLVKGSWWRVFGIGIVFALITTVVASAIYFPLEALASEADSGVLSLTGTVIAGGLSNSFGALSATLLYFDLRARATEDQSEGQLTLPHTWPEDLDP